MDHLQTMTCSHSFMQLAMNREPQPCDIQLFKTKTLGTGSYGVVCKALCDQRPCAAKLLHPIFFQSNDPGVVATRTRFERECRFLNEMKHPHVIEYLGTTHDHDSGLLVLLMELMDENLTHFLEHSQQPLAYHVEVDLCHDIAQALAYIHSNGIVHRDLSSNNILLSAGKAKITDFGMSKLLDVKRCMTPLTMCPGTLVYMPPEALKDQPVYSKKIDCFSFGVLEIQIMTRRYPDPGPAMQNVQDPRYSMGRLHLSIPDSERRKSHINLIDPTHTLLPTALSCLSYSEEDRPSAQDLCRQLATFKETTRYAQSAQQTQEMQELQQQLAASDSCIHSLQQQLQTKNQQLRDTQKQLQESQGYIHDLQHELQTKKQELQISQTQLQDSQRRNQELTHQVEEGQHTIAEREGHVHTLNEQLQASEEITAQFQENLLQHEHIRQEHDYQILQEQDVFEAGGQPITPAVTQTEQSFMQQETIPNLSWKRSNAPETMHRGSVAVDDNMVYCNGSGSCIVHSYNSQNEVWGRLPDCTYIDFCLVIVQHMLTTVGGFRNGPTNSLLSLSDKRFRRRKWSPHFPAMPTERYNTAAVCSDFSLIVAGGYDDRKILPTVEVLDTNTRQWSTASSLLHPYSEATLGICGNRLYMLGGYDDEHGQTHSVLTCSIPELLQNCTHTLAEELQTLTLDKKQVWRHVANVPHTLSTCSILYGRLAAVGGQGKNGAATTNIITYDERTDSWQAMADMPTARCLALAATVSGKVMVIGGAIGDLGRENKLKIDFVQIWTVL